MGIIDKDLLLYSSKILNSYAETHKGEDGETGRVVNAINILMPILSKINNME